MAAAPGLARLPPAGATEGEVGMPALAVGCSWGLGATKPGVTGCALGTLRAAVRGCCGGPPGDGTSVWVRCWATCWTATACCLACWRVAASSVTGLTPFAAMTWAGGAIIVFLTTLLFTIVMLLTTVVLLT